MLIHHWISRTYRPKDEEGEVLPPESTKVQVKAQDIIRQTVDVLTRLFDATATKDWANCKARADVVVDGQTLISQAPATYLLFLEKQLTDLHTFIKKLPVLDAGETWGFDASADCWATEPVQTLRAKRFRATMSRPRPPKSASDSRWPANCCKTIGNCNALPGTPVAILATDWPPGRRRYKGRAMRFSRASR